MDVEFLLKEYHDGTRYSVSELKTKPIKELFSLGEDETYENLMLPILVNFLPENYSLDFEEIGATMGCANFLRKSVVNSKVDVFGIKVSHIEKLLAELPVISGDKPLIAFLENIVKVYEAIEKVHASIMEQ